VEEEDIADGFRRQSLAKSPPIISTPATLSPPNTGDPFIAGFPHRVRGSTGSLPSLNDDDDYEQYLHTTDTERLHRGAPSIKSAYETTFRPTQECPTTKHFYQSRFTWVFITIVLICLFSTVFSGIFLGLALKAPRYGRRITSQGSFTPSDAILLTSIMAKLIELTFVTSFVAFLGQVLSRRAFMKEQGRGVTLSELSMWRWVVQPGTLITHWETAVYAGLSVLGILSLLSAILATLYTPATTALVQPLLKQGHWDNILMAGRVKTEFANITYLQETCQTPITQQMDNKNARTACLQVSHAGQAYHNYQRYMSSWQQAAINGTTDQKKRPPGFALLHENTTIIPQWINVLDTVAESKKHKRAINSVALAFPHAGVFAAARDQRNDLLQPEELNSEGTYSVRASVPSPVLNVYCANLNKDELEPIVYDEWPNNANVDIYNWNDLRANATTMNKTVVDDLFGWTKQDKVLMSDYPPVFARIPKPFNTIMNHTSFAWNRGAVYLLASGGPKDDGINLNGTYALCKLYTTLTPECSTQYNATGSGGSMEALCEEKSDDMAFNKSYTDATDTLKQTNWRDVAFDWANSMSLNTGLMDGDASNSRILTQLILSNNDTQGNIDLNPALPSIAEALAVMSGSTLLSSALDSPFIMSWNYTGGPVLNDSHTQYFNASVKAQQYASGGVDSVSKGWMVVLLLVFLMNIFVLFYFLLHRGLVTDFSEPPNLFALAVNSPPSHLFAGSCGGGPEGKQYVVNWFVNTEGDHLYMEPGQKPAGGFTGGHVHPHAHARSSGTGWFGGATNSFNRLRHRGLGVKASRRPETRLRPASVVETDYELEDGKSTRTQKTYNKLSKRTSML
jgi:hypothetical protein